MAARAQSLLWPTVLGASAGVLAAVLVWQYARKKLNDQLSQGSAELSRSLATGSGTLDTAFAQGRNQVTQLVGDAVRSQVPPAVDTQIRATLSQYGITPANSRLVTSQISRILAWTS